MYNMLKNYDPVPHKNEMQEFCFKLYQNTPNGKNAYAI